MLRVQRPSQVPSGSDHASVDAGYHQHCGTRAPTGTTELALWPIAEFGWIRCFRLFTGMLNADKHRLRVGRGDDSGHLAPWRAGEKAADLAGVGICTQHGVRSDLLPVASAVAHLIGLDP